MYQLETYVERLSNAIQKQENFKYFFNVKLILDFALLKLYHRLPCTELWMDVLNVISFYLPGN